MPWCHTCRIEYPVDLDECPECGHVLVDAPAPERRLYAGVGLVTVAILPPEQAFVASERLDRDGIPSALRETGSDGASMDPAAVHVLVPPTQLADARRVLRGRRRRGTRPWMSYMLLVSAIAVFLSGAMVVVQWILTGSPLPR
jgi:hypothetical protein